MWKLHLDQSNLAHQLARMSLLPHLAIITEWDNSEREHYYLFSAHLQHVNFPGEYNLAKYKFEVLLLILNAALSLDGDKHQLHGSDILYTYPNGVSQTHYGHQDPMLHIEQLQNPFVTAASLPDERPDNRVSRIISLAHDDELVREVIVLYGLSLGDYLYLLINIFKISENIEHDFKQMLTHPKMNAAIQKRIEDELKKFRNGTTIRHYMNTRAGSGLQARHGANTTVFNKSKPTVNEILNDVQKLINAWLDAKLELG
ncbi:hypothetical protein K0T92_16330 [Paenibacillus oenotherae]|uniref:Cthe-2314-like HEPN domain-containing protein n=1 Tax=Paenibacillus oenotherae TaxID=1435645 RepID=A0ABS7D9Q2_9BACL|nr:hypothetical protein [Paenibacillus oenotherae]MBW7476301.1 hypothetical protein [Paenibacillus oenotherae]